MTSKLLLAEKWKMKSDFAEPNSLIWKFWKCFSCCICYKIVCSRHQTHCCHAWVATNSFNEILQNVCLKKESPRKQVLSFWNNKWKCSQGAFSYILFTIQVEIFSSNLYLLSIKNLSFFSFFNRFVLPALIFMPVGVKLLLFVSHRRKIVSHLQRHFEERRKEENS